ncbi:TetR/AcrR family transcriptional regulator [Acidicapsa ligni]|uniref:TetR/AcrR family transcriptional regulator n=1 Tax=Acidicapsa ligni TaxID=542300 RepID=UPI0021E088AE|nr:TetR/AcrR family transcriptional regulator [Acidicapsa ligni]
MTKSTRKKRLDPRKTPAQSRSAATVTAVLEAAARILERKGFAGYTTNAVAEVAGVSIGSLYQYFPNKDALTVALIERESEALLADIVAGDSITEGRSGLKHLIGAAVAHQMRRPKLARLLDFEEDRLPIRARIRRVGDLLHAALVRSLTAATSLSAEEIDIAALDILAMARGIIDAAGDRGETDARGLEKRVGRAVFGYLGI